MKKGELSMSAVKKSLPDFKKLWSNYPVGKAEDVKEVIGGKVSYPWIKNTCVIRISRSFNYAGNPIPSNHKGLHVISGADKKWYAYRVKEFKEYLIACYGQPKVTVNSNKWIEIIPKLFGKQGIILFEVDRWSDATGHITLWNGVFCVNGDCYFQEAKKIHLWIATN